MSGAIEYPGLVWVKDPVNLAGEVTGVAPRRRHHSDCWHFERDEAGNLLGPPPYRASDEQMSTLPACQTCAETNSGIDYSSRSRIQRRGEICPSCFMERPLVGACPTCGEDVELLLTCQPPMPGPAALTPPPADVLTGVESFRGVDATVADFWAYGFRDLRTNTTRGLLVEWLVARAVGATEIQPEWAAFDVLSADRIRIEVKSSGYLQSWAQAKPSAITFGNLKTRKWDPLTGEGSEPTFAADVYVLAVQTAQRHEDYDALDVTQWDFYVLSRSTLLEIDQRSMGLARVQAETARVAYSDLAAAIVSAASG